MVRGFFLLLRKLCIIFLLNQNFRCDCFLIFVFYLNLTEFAWFKPKIVLNIKTEQF